MTISRQCVSSFLQKQKQEEYLETQMARAGSFRELEATYGFAYKLADVGVIPSICHNDDTWILHNSLAYSCIRVDRMAAHPERALLEVVISISLESTVPSLVSTRAATLEINFCAMCSCWFHCQVCKRISYCNNPISPREPRSRQRRSEE